jgi:hypothetical protein
MQAMVMCRLVLIVVVATGCDQGAKAASPMPTPQTLEIATPQPPVFEPMLIRSDEDFVQQAFLLVDELFQFFADGEADCDRIAARVETWAAQNVTRIGRLTEYSKTHPAAQAALTKAFEPRMNELMKKITPAFTKCSSNQRLMNAFKKFDDQQRQLGQRPR